MAAQRAAGATHSAHHRRPQGRALAEPIVAQRAPFPPAAAAADRQHGRGSVRQLSRVSRRLRQQRPQPTDDLLEAGARRRVARPALLHERQVLGVAIEGRGGEVRLLRYLRVCVCGVGGGWGGEGAYISTLNFLQHSTESVDPWSRQQAVFLGAQHMCDCC